MRGSCLCASSHRVVQKGHFMPMRPVGSALAHTPGLTVPEAVLSSAQLRVQLVSMAAESSGGPWGQACDGHILFAGVVKVAKQLT